MLRTESLPKPFISIGKIIEFFIDTCLPLNPVTFNGGVELRLDPNEYVTSDN